MLNMRKKNDDEISQFEFIWHPQISAITSHTLDFYLSQVAFNNEN